MIKKSLIFAVLATFCLAMVLFTVIPVGSYGTYDPWMDLNDDGKITAPDIAAPCAAYGSTGDPTKNVNVTNWPSTPLHNYTGAEEYTVLDVNRIVNGTEYGDYVISINPFFAFSPKENFVAVTNFAYRIMAYEEGVGLRFYNYAIDFDGVIVAQSHLEIMDSCPTAGGGIAPLAANYIHPGINTMHLQFEDPMYVLKISVYVEYQYQA